MRKLKLQIKQLFFLVRKAFYFVFHGRHPIFRKKNYFFNEFSEKTKGFNIDAIDFSKGVVLGSFEGENYLMNCEPGNLIESTIYIEGAWELHITTLISQILGRSPGIMIDVGANIGANTIPLAVRHPDNKFYCYEPHPEVFKKLKSNIKLNNLKNVSATNSAVTNSDAATLKFYAQKTTKNMGLSSLELNPDIAGYDEITVPIVGIDKLFSGKNERVSFIKIDAQGADPDVLKSAAKTIKKYRPVIIFEIFDRYYSEAEKKEIKKFLKTFFGELDYSIMNITHGFKYYPLLDITKDYEGDILAIPR